ncbi:MAG: hypothetical protein HYT79_00195 [Elusimicrobia bacterium]|nr:hypothetical protein [Elusimicrobiota bacterium]
MIPSPSSIKRLVAFGLTLQLTVAPAWPWGTEGHRIIATNAVKLLPKELRRLFIGHSEDFAYYSTVPDVVWRRIGVDELEGPTHYLNSENYSVSPGSDHFPVNPNQARGLFRPPPDRPEMTFRENGIAPWRVRQLHNQLTSDFEASAAPGRGRSTTIGLNAGLMGHYVGDAAQPFHATYDHNGRSSGHAGIHSYFETKLVNELSRNHQLRSRSLAVAKARMGEWSHITDPVDPARTALRVLMDSYKSIDKIYELDSRYAIIPGKAPNARGYLRRVSPSIVAPHFAPIIEERMALGSVALARLIEHAWIRAGRPNTLAAFGRLIVRPGYIRPPL